LTKNYLSPLVYIIFVGRKILLYSDYCKHCDKVKDLLRADLISGKILLLSVDRNKDAGDVAQMFGGVPSLIEEENGEVRELVILKNK